MADGSEPRLVIHGGAGSAIRDENRAHSVEESLRTIRDALYPALVEGDSAESVVVEACRRLEDDPLFNAGLGSVLQSDGRARLSASLMTTDPGRFSAAINAERIRHPIELARVLQDREDAVLSEAGTQRLARELGMSVFDPVTDRRLANWYDERRDELAECDGPEDRSSGGGFGTVGAVALDREGDLAAATSTGGRGFEYVGRVSDSAMPAGNYATQHAAVSCTGVGEDIVDECAAARIAIRVADGADLGEAFEKTFEEAEERDRQFGGVGIAADGRIAWGRTTDVLLGAWRTPAGRGHTLDTPVEPTVRAVTG
ncbi:MAG: isoaspartyl peptidase/L-asparaginase [Bradymonadaceae bacterium]